jgi:non-specific protein-tyrosine kinase
VDTPLRRVLITSATPQDGKTTVSTNLSVVWAQGERKVVLMDADMRRPQVHVRLEMFNRNGLSDFFLQDSDDFLRNISPFESVAGLSVITSGSLPPNPAELLTSKKMLHILDRINQDYDLVLIDTPPVLSVTDSVVLSANMDGVVVVVKPGKTHRKDLHRTLEQLSAVGARILGIILNDVEVEKYSYYYGQSYSAYYGEEATQAGKKGIALGKTRLLFSKKTRG